MKYDQLINKKKELNTIINNSNNCKNNEKYYEGLKKGISESFTLINSTITFYKQYKDDVKLLMKEQNKLWLKWVDYYNGQTGIDNSNYKNRYNKWLFDNIFSNIGNEEKSELLELY
jgi:hypothetical protein